MFSIRPAPPDPDPALVAAARAKYRGDDADLHIARGFPVAADRLVHAMLPSQTPPRLSDLGAFDYESAHEDAEEDPERFQPW